MHLRRSKIKLNFVQNGSIFSKTNHIVSKMPAYVYTLNLKGGNKYVGYTENPSGRISQHFSGNGSKWTQKHQPVSVNSIQEVSSVAYAKKLETIIYHKMKDYHGGSKVRGAGNTRSD
jgi:predicted GIY-YIG superfamily endonuclease